MSQDKKHDLVQIHRVLAGEASGQLLEHFRIDQNMREFISFTADFEEVSVHYVADPDINAYVHCNDPNGNKTDCTLCRAENKAEVRYLVPIYDPRTEAVCALAVSPSCRPNALLPQLVAVLEKGRPQVVFIRRDQAKYVLRATDVEEGMDDGSQAITFFNRRYQAGEIRLADVYVRLPNEKLASLPIVAKSLGYRGLKT
jgi:hypothetical protein